MSSDVSFGRRVAVDAGFDAFVARYSTTLLHSAYLLIGDHGQAEDVLQLALLRTARRWEVARQAPEAYARQVLVNLSRDRQRRLNRRVGERPLGDHGASELVQGHADRVIVHDAVIAAVRSLPVRQREVVVLRFFADLTIVDTAAAIGSSQATVKSHTRRALGRLRKLLADESRATVGPTNEVSNAD
jgi:RNA polymerase sigma-70 factor (sigma-E family)